MELSKSECVQIARKYWKREDVEVLAYGSEGAPDAARGLIAVSNSLWFRVRLGPAKTETARFFVKIPPSNPYHLALVQKSRAFDKEAEFFNTIYPKLKPYLGEKVFPKCLYAKSTITVLEDLRASDYRNFSGETLDYEHCKAALKSLAVFNAASLLYEAEHKTTFDRIHEDIFFISWFSHFPDHPGNKHLQTGVAAMEAVIGKYFPEEQEAIRAQACQLMRDLPQMLLPSSKHRNVVSHNDLWNNNIMFRYDGGELKTACLIDLQLFGYNPPAHDIYTLIFMNGMDETIIEKVDDLVSHYYDTLRKITFDRGYNLEDFLSIEDFNKSKDDSVKLGLSSAILFTHFTALPEEYLAEVIHNENKMKQLMEQDRTDIVFKSIDNSTPYKRRLFATIRNLLSYLKGEVKF